MIRYSLVCNKAHNFEGWFRNSDDFDKQKARSLVTCPHCGSVEVSKGLMAPSVSTSRGREKTVTQAEREEQSQVVKAEPEAAQGAGVVPVDSDPGNAAANGAAAEGRSMLMSGSPEQKAVIEGLRELRKKVLESSDYVGSGFAEEARKIHYGEAEARNIYGETSLEDAKDLLEEGVSLLPLPVLPEEKN